MNEINDLVEISRYASERFDLVQAAGGNGSVKLDNGEMLVKASGYTLSEVNMDRGHSTVSTKQAADIVRNNDIISVKDKREREALTSKLMQAAAIDKHNRPSIETLMHSLLLKYTLHVHSVVVNIIVSQNNYKLILRTIFKDDAVAMVDYETPGIELALKLNKELQSLGNTPNIIFLQNHGLIVTSNNKKEIKKNTEYVIDKIEHFLNLDMSSYKLTSSISQLLNSINQGSNISYISEDILLNKYLTEERDLFFSLPFCPDTVVYCGASVVEIDDLLDVAPLEKYRQKFHDLPKVIIYREKIFLIASSIKKAKEVEEVLKFHIMILAKSNKQNMKLLDLEEIGYLSNWEAEKYRQNL